MKLRSGRTCNTCRWASVGDTSARRALSAAFFGVKRRIQSSATTISRKSMTRRRHNVFRCLYWLHGSGGGRQTTASQTFRRHRSRGEDTADARSPNGLRLGFKHHGVFAVVSILGARYRRNSKKPRAPTPLRFSMCRAIATGSLRYGIEGVITVGSVAGALTVARSRIILRSQKQRRW